MTFRNSVKSVVRTPVKTCLFLLLVAAVTALACLGIGMRRATGNILKDANDVFETTAILQYHGVNYPDPDSIDAKMVRDLSGYDLTTLTSRPEVLSYDTQQNFGGVITGLKVSAAGKCAYQNYGVIIFRVESDDDEFQRCQIIQVMYAPEYKVGSFFNLRMSQEIMSTLGSMERKFTKGDMYIAHGRFYQDLGRKVIFEIESYKNAAAPKSEEIKSLLKCPVIDLTGFEPSMYAQVSGFSVMENIAEACTQLNNYLNVNAADDPSSFLCFQEQQTHLTSGRFLTKADRGKRCCMVSDILMQQMKLSLGDTVELGLVKSVDTTPAYRCYWPDAGFLHQDHYQIIGTFKESMGLVYNVFIPRDESFDNQCIDYTVCRFRLDNAQAAAWQTEVQKYLLPQMQLYVFDHGYADVVGALKTMEEGTDVILIASGISALIILLLFSYLYVAKQKLPVRIMLSLGAGRKKSMMYLIFGALILVLVAVILGAAAGHLASGRIISNAYLDAASGFKYDDRFSNAVVAGARTSFDMRLESSPTDAILSAGIILVSALVLTSLFAFSITRDNALKKVTKSKFSSKAVLAETQSMASCETDQTENDEGKLELSSIERQAAKTGTFFKLVFPIRMAIRLIFRGKAKNIVAALVSMCMAVLIVVFSVMLDGYRAKREKVYDNIPILTYITNYSGRQIDKLSIPEDTIKLFNDTENVTQTHLSQRIKYQLLGVVKRADGTAAPDPGQPNIPMTGFAAETFADKISGMDDVYFTNMLRYAPAYFFEQDVKFTFLDGYDESAFAKKEAVCCVSQEFLDKNGLALGDVIRLTDLRRGSMGTLYGVFEAKIIGICPMTDGGNDIYASMAAKEPVHYLMELIYMQDLYDVTERYCHSVMAGYDPEDFPEIIAQTKFVPLYDSASFVLKNARVLKEYKDRLQKERISPVGKVTQTRVYAVVRDQILYKTVDNLTRHISYMKMLNAGVYVLSIAMGFVVSYLLTRTRKPELALLRSTGAGRGTTFMTFFLEQGVICVFGTALGVLLCYLIYSQLRAAGAAVYALCYLAGVAASVLMMNRGSVLAILGAKE